MFPVSCKVVHVVCVFPAEDIRVRLLMFFKSEALTVEEGKEQERVQPLSKEFATSMLTAVVVFPAPAGAAGASTVVVRVESALLLMVTGEESLVDLGGWEQTVVVTDTTKLFGKSPLRSCSFPGHTLLAVAEELAVLLIAQGVVVFNNLGLSCPFLLSEELRSFRHVFKERGW